MAVGRDVYIDSRMILQKLEEMLPHSEAHLALSSPETAGLAALLNKFTTDASLFSLAVGIFPPDHPSLQDEKFLNDRAGFNGKGWTMGAILKHRPEHLVQLRQCFDTVESLFADGREWVANTKDLSMADFEGRQ